MSGHRPRATACGSRGSRVDVSHRGWPAGPPTTWSAGPSTPDLELDAAPASCSASLAHGTLGQDAAGPEDGDPVADLVDLVEQVAGEEDRHAALVGEARG